MVLARKAYAAVIPAKARMTKTGGFVKKITTFCFVQNPQAVNFATTFREIGVIKKIDGNAIGHAVKNACSQRVKKPVLKPVSL